MLKRTIALLLILAVLLTAGCAEKVPEWQEQFDLGMRFLSEGNYEEAILAFTAVLEIEPNLSDAYFYRAQAYVMGARALSEQEGGRREKIEEYLNNAESDYKKAAELDPEKQKDTDKGLTEVTGLREQIITAVPEEIVADVIPGTFFEENGYETNAPDWDASTNGMTLGYTTDGENSLYTEDFGYDASRMYTIPLTFRRAHGDPESPNLVEYIPTNAEVWSGGFMLDDEENQRATAQFLWEAREEWRNYSLTEDDVETESEAYLAAYTAFVEEFVASAGGYKILSCTFTIDTGTFREESLNSDGLPETLCNISFAAVDRYTGLTYAPSGGNNYTSGTVHWNGASYKLSFIHTNYAEFYKNAGNQLHPEFCNEGWIWHGTITVIVPADYDGLTFMLGSWEDGMKESDTSFLNFNESQYYGKTGNYFFSHDDEYKSTQKVNTAYDIACSATEFDKNATQNTSVFEPNCFGYNRPDLGVWALAVPKLTADGELDFTLINPKNSTALVSACVIDLETYDVYGMSGLIHPGYRIDSLALTGTGEDHELEIVIAFYDPDTLEHLENIYLRVDSPV